eukprot:scaffold3.g6770.t1
MSAAEREAATTTDAGAAATEVPLPSAVPATPPPPAQPLLPVVLVRKASAAADANEALDFLAEGLGAEAGAAALLTEGACRDLLTACLERGNAALAMSIFRAMSGAGAAPGSNGSSLLTSVDEAGSGGRAAVRWPPASVQTAAALVVGLSQALCTREATQVIASIRNRGLPTSEDVGFGFVVACPPPRQAPAQRLDDAQQQWQTQLLLGPDAVATVQQGRPLAVVQPQEGCKAVADSISRYEYELFSGTVTSASSESLVNEQNWLLAAARRVGIVRQPPTGAVHTLVVQTPSGLQRTFRFATATADVPAKVGDRVTVVSTPQRPVLSQWRLLSATQPGTKPGEALSLSNHSTRLHVPLLRPPAAGSGGLPSWALPATVLLVGSDAASGLIDPVLPYLVAGAAATTIAAGVAANSLVLPRLRQLPARSHVALESRVIELVEGAEEDVRILARLWQLQAKMGAVGGAASYNVRLERKVVELVDAYARVLSMIEIEVEMESEVPAAEVLGIEQQIARLSEIEGLQEEWALQAEAQEEVERLLRAT